MKNGVNLYFGILDGGAILCVFCCRRWFDCAIPPPIFQKLCTLVPAYAEVISAASLLATPAIKLACQILICLLRIYFCILCDLTSPSTPYLSYTPPCSHSISVFAISLYMLARLLTFCPACFCLEVLHASFEWLFWNRWHSKISSRKRCRFLMIF